MDKQTFTLNKRCLNCGEIKSLDEFYREPHRGGTRSQCKDCMNGRGRLYHKKNREVERIKLREWREKNPEKARQESLRNLVKNREAFYERRRRTNRENPEKMVARNKLNYAVIKGRVIRQTCKECGFPNSEGHHNDYNKPLDVEWLCRRHHARHHANI